MSTLTIVGTVSIVGTISTVSIVGTVSTLSTVSTVVVVGTVQGVSGVGIGRYLILILRCLINPFAPTYASSPLAQCYHWAELDKKRK